MSDLSIPEGIVRFTHALVEDASLRSWFLGLEQLSESLRRNSFMQMAEQIRADGKDPELAAAIAAMTHSDLCNAVRKTVIDRCSAASSRR